MRIPTEWETEGSASPFLYSDRGDFFRKLNYDALGWCGHGGNNTLCLSSLLLLRSSKGFPGIISLLIIIPWHTQYQWVKWFSHNHLTAETGPGHESPDFWSSSLLIASCTFKNGDPLHGEETIAHHRCKGLRHPLGKPGRKVASPAPGSLSWWCMNWL